MSKVKVTQELDALHPFLNKDWHLRTLHIEDDDNGLIATLQVRPWSGSVEIRSDGKSISIPTQAMPALLRAIRETVKECAE